MAGGVAGGDALLSPAAHEPHEAYEAAISRLQMLSQAVAPSATLLCLTDTCRLISQAAEALGAPPPSADELMPLVAYVLLRAQVASLPAELALAGGVASEAQQSGEGGYCLATFQVATSWAMALKWDQLYHPALATAENGAATPAAQQARRRREGGSGGGTGSGSKVRGRSKGSDGRPRSRGGGGVHESISSSMDLLRSLEAELEMLQRTDADGGESGAGGGGGGEAARAELARLSVKQLLALAKAHGIDCSSCVEKARAPVGLPPAHEEATEEATLARRLGSPTRPPTLPLTLCRTPSCTPQLQPHPRPHSAIC